MSIHVNLEAIRSIREHPKRARIDMLLALMSEKFGDGFDRDDVEARFGEMNVKRLEATASKLLKLDELDELDDILDAEHHGAPPRDMRR